MGGLAGKEMVFHFLNIPNDNCITWCHYVILVDKYMYTVVFYSPLPPCLSLSDQSPLLDRLSEGTPSLRAVQ